MLVAFSLELGADLTMQHLLVGFDGQEHVGPLIQAPLKNGRVATGQLLLFEKASPTEKAAPTAWISTPYEFAEKPDLHFPQEHWLKTWSTNPLERLDVAATWSTSSQ